MLSREQKLDKLFGQQVNAKSVFKGVADVASGGMFSAKEGQKDATKALERGQEMARADILRGQKTGRADIGEFFPQAIDALDPRSAELQLAAFSGAQGPAAQAQAFQGFQDSPGQAFLRQQAEQSLLRNQAAIGGLGGGNVRRALQEQAIGLASQDFGNQMGLLQNVAGMQGQRGANISNLLQGQGTGLANIATGQAANLANIASSFAPQIAQSKAFTGQLRGQQNVNLGESGAAFAGGAGMIPGTPGIAGGGAGGGFAGLLGIL